MVEKPRPPRELAPPIVEIDGELWALLAGEQVIAYLFIPQMRIHLTLLTGRELRILDQQLEEVGYGRN